MKKVQVKILTENIRKQYEKDIKNIIDIYTKRMVKDLKDKIFKHHIYIEYFNAALDFVRRIGLEKTSNITFNKKPRFLEDHMI